MIKAKSEPSAGPIRVEPADPVQQARTRARQRLIGAVVLLVVGIIGFPLVFETEPRPVPIDIPIEIPQRDGMTPLAVPTPRGKPLAPLPSASMPASELPVVPVARPAAAAPASSSGLVIESAADAGRDVTPPPVLPAASTAASLIASTPASASARAAPASPARPDDGARALALLEGRGASTASAAAAGRFVVQVGAFADNDVARDARRQVERLGLKTYVQVAQTVAGSRVRVRVGPFATRAEADAALAKARAAGIDAVVLAL